MNKILNLFDEDYVLKMFQAELLPFYPQFSRVEKVKIRPYKKMAWTTTYHVVISFDVYLAKADGRRTKIMIVCSAHSEEPRENVFQAMKYLWDHNFNQGHIDIPRPLFYSEYFRGTFYRGIVGENLLHYIVAKDREEVKKLVPLAAELFARLHKIPAGAGVNFNPINSRIKTVVPGVKTTLNEISSRYQGKFDDDFLKIYEYLIEQEEKFLKNNLDLRLIHGDAHTENIIKTGEDRVGLIDFTDFCLGDFTRDLGTFLQQMEYKIVTKNSDQAWAEEMKSLFLESYLRAAGLRHGRGLEERIRLYYDWTAVRTSVFLFLKYNSDPKRGEALLQKVKQDLKINV